MFPTMTVAEQLAFDLNIRSFNTKSWMIYQTPRTPQRAIAEKMEQTRAPLKGRYIRNRVLLLARLLSINHLLDRYPQALSGGERRR